jgi:mRNA-degrading endonuclease YafQ of YafQ-DinJ toxin-antitoxin module
MNITWDIRLIFRITDDKIYFEKIWTHSELYW